MFPDLGPVFELAMFALGFVPVIVVAAVLGLFVPMPIWAAVAAASLSGLAAVAWMKRH